MNQVLPRDNPADGQKVRRMVERSKLTAREKSMTVDHYAAAIMRERQRATERREAE